MKTVTAENVTEYRKLVLQACSDPTHEKYLLPEVPPVRVAFLTWAVMPAISWKRLISPRIARFWVRRQC